MLHHNRLHPHPEARAGAREDFQRTLVRAAAHLLLAAPFVVLVVYLFTFRHLSLAELFALRHLPLAAVALLGVVGLRYRRRLLTAVDRRFFPRQHEARTILERLPERIRGVGEAAALADLLRRDVALAWRLEQAALLVRRGACGLMVDARRELRPLALGSELLRALAQTRRPLEVDLAAADSPQRRLPEAERHWLVDGRVRLLVPAFALDGSLNAVIVLGAKAAELPFTNEDFRLLAGVASATGLIVEILELRHRGAGPPAAAEIGGRQEILSSSRKAAECLSCGQVYPAGTPLCRKCDLELGEALVPYALRRMFRFEERIGIGGMAVVYRATDLKLGRSVAVKTLPRVSPEAAVRLQHEARTAATVSHPGLAAIYGIETWEGTPMLILEYLDGGTLSERLAREPLTARAAIDTGLVVAQALEEIHAFGILHRDVKPSNIGYTRHGAAKLLDFGIARIYQDLRRDTEDPAEILTADGRTMQQHDNVTGTLCYFSPEALDEAPPDPTFDLWSLSVVLYEALTARNLFYRPLLKDMLEAIRAAEVPDLRSQIPDCPLVLAELFRLELHVDKARRSQTGSEYRERLERVRQALPTPPAPRGRPAAPVIGEVALQTPETP